MRDAAHLVCYSYKSINAFDLHCEFDFFNGCNLSSIKVPCKSHACIYSKHGNVKVHFQQRDC